MLVLSDLKQRGVKDILIASVDGLNGFSEALKSIYPKCEVQRCIVHQIRNSSKFVPWKDRKQFCADMKKIYNAVNEEQALSAFSEFSEKWNKTRKICIGCRCFLWSRQRLRKEKPKSRFTQIFQGNILMQ